MGKHTSSEPRMMEMAERLLSGIVLDDTYVEIQDVSMEMTDRRVITSVTFVESESRIALPRGKQAEYEIAERLATRWAERAAMLKASIDEKEPAAKDIVAMVMSALRDLAARIAIETYEFAGPITVAIHPEHYYLFRSNVQGRYPEAVLSDGGRRISIGNFTITVKAMGR